jgi:asparagine synthase (glutamine-hydrolysing)
VDAPAAVLLAAFRELRQDLPRHLRGSYAVVISDGRRLWAFRDHLGTTALFWRQAGGRCSLGSEAKQVVAVSGIPRRPDHDVIETLFYGAENDTTGSALAGVDRLPKSTLLEVDGTMARTGRYWEPENLLESGGFTRDEVRPRFDGLMSQAVDRALTGRDALALSGGIDSPTLAAFAAPAYRARFGRPLPAFSMVFPDYPACDERRYIEDVTRALDLPLHAYQPDPRHQGVDRLEHWVRLVDGPWSGAWAPNMDDDRYCRLGMLGISNLLTGDFAEYAADFRFHLLAHLVARGRLRAAGRQVRDQRRAGVPAGLLIRQLASAFVPGRVLRAYHRRRPRFPTPDFVDTHRVLRSVSIDVVGPRERWRRQQLAAFIGPGVSLEAHHIVQEASGVRVRNPWGDIDLWEFFLRMPAEMKFPGAQPKQLIRRLMRGRLPDSVLDRADKTLLDAFVRAGMDYPGLQAWLSDPEYRMPGVDYSRLRERLERRDLDVFGYMWAKDLAATHAFVERS